MSSEQTPNSRKQAAFVARQKAAGQVLFKTWIPAELVDQARKVVAELVEQRKGRK